MTIADLLKHVNKVALPFRLAGNMLTLPQTQERDAWRILHYVKTAVSALDDGKSVTVPFLGKFKCRVTKKRQGDVEIVKGRVIEFTLDEKE